MTAADIITTGGPNGILSGGGLAELDARYIQQSGGTLASGTVTGLLTLNGGTDTAGSAPVLTALGFTSGTAAQLADLTRDYLVYLQVGTAGTAMSVSIGHTSAASDVTVVSNATATAGEVVSVRLPAGWWLKWTATTATLANQVAVGC